MAPKSSSEMFAHHTAAARSFREAREYRQSAEKTNTTTANRSRMKPLLEKKRPMGPRSRYTLRSARVFGSFSRLLISAFFFRHPVDAEVAGCWVFLPAVLFADVFFAGTVFWAFEDFEAEAFVPVLAEDAVFFSDFVSFVAAILLV